LIDSKTQEVAKDILHQALLTHNYLVFTLE